MLQLKLKKELSIERIIQRQGVLCYAAAEAEERVELREYNTKCVLCYAAAEAEEKVEHRSI